MATDRAAPDWNHADRLAARGVHLLRMSSRKDWIVRHGLSIELTSSTYAQQSFDVDIDLDEVKQTVPSVLEAPKSKRIWLPVLRLPTSQPKSQRVVAASHELNRGVPIMPQADVRRQLAAGLTWLILDRRPGIRQLRTSHKAQVRNAVHDVIETSLETGFGPELPDHWLGKLLHEEDQVWLREMLERPAGSQPVDGNDNDNGNDNGAKVGEPDLAGLAECLAYARRGYLVVVGVEQRNPYPHVRLNLLPAELQLTKVVPGRPNARQVLGFENAGVYKHRPRRPRDLLPVLLARLTFPALYHLKLPVPAVADLEAVHVDVTTPEDVAITPAVLHHDTHLPQSHNANRQLSQSQMRDGVATPSPLANLAAAWSALQSGTPEVTDWRTSINRNAAKRLVEDLSDIAKTWDHRSKRLEQAERMLLHRMGSKAETAGSKAGVQREAAEMASELERLADAIETRRIGRRAIGKRLYQLVAQEDKIPHVEMTGDNDLRDHVARLHVDSTESVYRRRTDSRPEVNAIIRPSGQARKGYIRTAAVSSLISSVLLLVMWALVDMGGDERPNVEALVALLLLVPGLSVTLVGRVPGGTMRDLVLGQAELMAYVSLVPPVVTAALLAALFGNPESHTIHLNGTRIDLTMAWVLFIGLALSLIPATIVSLNYLRHRQGFDIEATVDGLLTLRRENEDPRDEVVDATVDSAQVAQITEAALFRIHRPHRRFMVLLTSDKDAPNLLKEVLDELEKLPDHLNADPEPVGREPETVRKWDLLVEKLGRRGLGSDPTIDGSTTVDAAVPGRKLIIDLDSDIDLDPGIERAPDIEPQRSGPALVESSMVTAVATTGVVMSIVSHDLRVDHQTIAPEDIQRSLTEMFVQRRNEIEIYVEDITEDAGYFLTRPVMYWHYSFTGVNERDRRTGLVNELVTLENEHRMIAYLYCPIRPRPADDLPGAPEHDAGAIRVGFAIFTDSATTAGPAAGPGEGSTGEDVGDHLGLRLAELAGRWGYDLSTHRNVADASGHGRRYSGEGTASGAASLMLVSAGPNRPGLLKDTFAAIADAGASFEGGTMVTDRGYACRTLRVWGNRARMERALDGSGASGRWSVRDSDVTDHVDPHRDDPSTPEPHWIISWIRWRLDYALRDERVQTILFEAVEDWRRKTVATDHPVEFANIEFLTSRLKDQRIIVGKARYRFGGPNLGDDIADQLNRSLENELVTRLKQHLTHRNRFIVVDRHEPEDPRLALPN